MVTIYHNPRCSKSREALALLRERGLTPDVVLYLETPPDAAGLKTLLRQLDLPARALLRTKEEEYQALGLNNPALSDDALIAAMVQHPRLIERPIVIHQGRAVIARPAEKALELLA